MSVVVIIGNGVIFGQSGDVNVHVRRWFLVG